MSSPFGCCALSFGNKNMNATAMQKFQGTTPGASNATSVPALKFQGNFLGDFAAHRLNANNHAAPVPKFGMLDGIFGTGATPNNVAPQMSGSLPPAAGTKLYYKA